jgi:hypothetical protein
MTRRRPGIAGLSFGSAFLSLRDKLPHISFRSQASKSSPLSNWSADFSLVSPAESTFAHLIDVLRLFTFTYLIQICSFPLI